MKDAREETEETHATAPAARRLRPRAGSGSGSAPRVVS